VRLHRGEYFALIEHLDAQIGRVLEALEASGQADRTWVFFTADHGLAVGHHGLMGKQNLYEHSVRAPLLVAGPGVKPRVVEAPVHIQDVMATCLDLAGADRREVDFQSLLPLIRGESSTATVEPVYAAYLDRQRALIEGDWKLIVYPKAGVVRLYNLARDPGEREDWASRPETADRRRHLLNRLRQTMREQGDALSLDGVQ
jgi:choline-sulfatase